MLQLIASALTTVIISTPAVSQDFEPLCGTTIRVGVRTDAPPFAAREADFGPIAGCDFGGNALAGFTGFTASLCAGFLEEVASTCTAHDPVQIEIIPVPISDRDALLQGEDGALDLLCGATTATVTRSVLLPSSPITFVTGTSVLANSGFLNRLSVQEGDMACRVGVVSGTTSAPKGGFSRSEIRLPGWQDFVRKIGCSEDVLGPGHRTEFASTLDAIMDLSKADADDRRADFLIGDVHILKWYLDNLETLPFLSERSDAMDAADVRNRLSIQNTILSIEPYAVVGSMPRPMTNAGDIQPAGLTVAAFSRYLVDLQSDSKKINGMGYGQMLRSCFGRNVDRSIWSIIDFQSNIRKGDFPD